MRRECGWNGGERIKQRYGVENLWKKPAAKIENVRVVLRRILRNLREMNMDSIDRFGIVFNGLISVLCSEEFNDLYRSRNIAKVVNSILLRALVRGLHIDFKVTNNENIIYLNAVDLVRRLSNINSKAYIKREFLS
jgi:hypothetical protein